MVYMFYGRRTTLHEEQEEKRKKEKTKLKLIKIEAAIVFLLPPTFCFPPYLHLSTDQAADPDYALV